MFVPLGTAIQASLSGDDGLNGQLSLRLAACVSQQVRAASTREFATGWNGRTNDPVAAPAASASAGLLGLSAGQAPGVGAGGPGSTTDSEALSQPNPSLATWLTGMLMSTTTEVPPCTPVAEAEAVVRRRRRIVEQLLEGWTAGLLGPEYSHVASFDA